jgi:hypothetical protein
MVLETVQGSFAHGRNEMTNHSRDIVGNSARGLDDSHQHGPGGHTVLIDILIIVVVIGSSSFGIIVSSHLVNRPRSVRST